MSNKPVDNKNRHYVEILVLSKVLIEVCEFESPEVPEDGDECDLWGAKGYQLGVTQIKDSVINNIVGHLNSAVKNIQSQTSKMPEPYLNKPLEVFSNEVSPTMTLGEE